MLVVIQREPCVGINGRWLLRGHGKIPRAEFIIWRSGLPLGIVLYFHWKTSSSAINRLIHVQETMSSVTAPRAYTSSVRKPQRFPTTNHI